jgi:hypothetical protein
MFEILDKAIWVKRNQQSEQVTAWELLLGRAKVTKLKRQLLQEVKPYKE